MATWLERLPEAEKAKRIKQYRAARRDKYAADPALRERTAKQCREYRDKNRNIINTRRKEKYWTDNDYREKHRQSKRGRDQRHTQLKTHYGISLQDYQAMIVAQDNRCAICSDVFTTTACVDHCHGTKKIRGLLCRKCNTGLGCFRDDPDLMTKAMDYLGGGGWR